MRTLGLSLMALFTFWAGAQAQIAAPLLNPSPFNVISPWNPAVYSWDGPSRVGGGFADGSFDYTASGNSTIEAAAGDGNAVQLRWVGESFAFGVDNWSLDMDIVASLGGGAFNLESTVAGASFQMDELFSIGVGQESGEILFGTTLTTGTLLIAGATLRLGEKFYLGFAAGTETIEKETTTVAGSAVEGDRGVTRFGAGYHSRDGENGLHVEVWRNELDAINTTTMTDEAEEATGVTLEVVFSNILIGYESVSGEELSATDGSVQEEEDSTTISLGWVPMEGLSIVVAITEIEINEPPTGDTQVFNMAFAGVTWAF